MNLVTLVEPPVEPVTVAEVYEFLRWDAEDDESPIVYPLQATIERHIRTARVWVEQATRRALVKQTLRLTLPELPQPVQRGYGRAGGFDVLDGIDLYRSPVASVSEVAYFDTENVLRVVAPADYFLAEGSIARLQFVRDWRVPEMYARDDALRITYLAGYPWSDSPPEYVGQVPAGLKDAICLQVQILADRFDVNEKMDVMRTRDDIISSYRVHNFQ